MPQVTWIKLVSGEWPKFRTVSLDRAPASGVYIIWHTGNPGRYVYVGQGNVGARIAAHRQRADILQYERYGTLMVTWAAVPAAQLNGVERYLADTLRPLVGDAYPDAAPLQVNLPAL